MVLSRANAQQVLSNLVGPMRSHHKYPLRKAEVHKYTLSEKYFKAQDRYFPSRSAYFRRFPPRRWCRAI